MIIVSCTDTLLGPDPANTRANIFEEFWKGVDAVWPEFETKKVNWDSLHRIYKPKADLAKTDEDISEILSPLLYSLKDRHTDVYTKGKNVINYNPIYTRNFYGFNWIAKNYLPNYRANGIIGYKLISPDVGYIYIYSFSDEDENKYTIIDQIIQEFGQVKGIIVDVRGNAGGNSNNGEVIACRFADQERTYAYVRHRINDSRTTLSDFIPRKVSPCGSTFKGKVAVLINRYSYSATEDFILMMKSFPNSILVGDFSGGGSGTRPVFKELPQGWVCRVSTLLLCDSNKQPITKGIPPDFFVQTTKADSLKGKDTIIEKALTELVK